MAESKPKDAIALLKADHEEVKKLFKDFESAKGDGRKEKLARQICLELTVHSMIEEEIFYPACKGVVEEDMIKEGYVEHDAAKLMIGEIEANEAGDDEYYDTKVKVLQEEIEHHIEEEEGKDGIFAQAKKGDLDLKAIGEQLAARKAELTAQFKDKLPQPQLTTMNEATV